MHLVGRLDDSVRPGDIEGSWVFDGEWFLLLNLAVGGYSLDEPTSGPPFPATSG